MESNYTYIFLIIAVSKFQTWKAIASEPSNGRTPNFQLEVQRVCSNSLRPCPFPVIYVLGTSSPEYICRPIISYSSYYLYTRLFLSMVINAGMLSDGLAENKV